MSLLFCSSLKFIVSIREPPDILKKISTFGKEEETHSLDEKTDVETDLSNLDKKYWELRNEIVQRKKQQK